MSSGTTDQAAENGATSFEPACRVVLVEGRSRQQLARKVDELIAPFEADQIVSVSFTAATSLFMWRIVYSAFVILRVEEQK
jgi:hypothetical protein